jgi:hypothetical protein
MDGVISSYSGSSALPPEAAEHIAHCMRCRSLIQALGEKQEVPTPSADQLQRIKAKVLGELRPVRPLPPSRVFLSAFGLIFLAVVAVGSLQLGAYGWGVLSVSQKIVIFTALAASAALLAVSMVRQMAPGSKHPVSPTLLPLGILVSLIIVMAAFFQWQKESAFVANGLFCLSAGLKYAIPGAFLFWLLLRRGAMLSPKLTGATAGGFAGLIGLAVLEIHCPNLNRYHILVWHLGVVLLSVLGGVALGAAVEFLGQPRSDRIP